MLTVRAAGIALALAAAVIVSTPRPAPAVAGGASADRVVTVAGDSTGLHVLVADAFDGYDWRTAATLGDPRVDTSLWIGQACVTGSGNQAVVVYAPREITNEGGAQGSLARAAVVNLNTGAVRQLGGGFSIAYFDPGCGTGEQAVLTRGGWGGDGTGAPSATGLDVVDARTGTVTDTVTVPGQVTSAVPYEGAIAAAGGSGVERVDDRGRMHLLAAATAVPFHLVPDAAGGLGYQSVTGRTVQLHRFFRGRSKVVATAASGTAELQQIGGHVWVTGPSAGRLRGLPPSWRQAAVSSQAQVSTGGAIAVTDARAASAAANPGSPSPVEIQARVLSGAHPAESFMVPAASAGGDDTSPVSPDRTCAVPLNDPHVQAYQPSFKQVEWAADEAVQGDLTDTRGPGIYGSSLPAYSPQGMFPPPGLDGGGSIPAQVLLGVLTQESNLQQASRHVVQGQASNPLASDNWYGNWVDGGSTNTGQVNWANSDCGYGIAQVTTGMCVSQGRNSDPQCTNTVPLPYDEQLAIAVDYQANIAAGLQVLAQKWNQLYRLGITPNGSNGGSRYIENWYLALWAYNSGLQPGASAGNTTGCEPGPSCTDGNGDWGLGFTNNPANSNYPPDRPQFGENSGAQKPGGGTYTADWDLAHPQYWPYQEKVIGWAFNGATLYDYSSGKAVRAYAYGQWPSGDDYPQQPSYGQFCTAADHCDASGLNPGSATGPDACQLTGDYRDHCWWHWPVAWTDCSTCGQQVLTYAAGASDPGPPAIAPYFRQQCSLPPDMSGAVIVGASDPAALGCPGENWTSAGPIDWTFGTAANGTNPSKILFDQVGAGFGGHFWFGYSIPSDQSSFTSTTPDSRVADEEITGTWPVPPTVTGWANVMVHIPSYGAWDPQTVYQINVGDGQPVVHRAVNQAQQANTWISLGVYHLGSGASVSLNNVTFGGLDRDVAWNALALVPSKPPAADYVAMGDSYSAGEGLQAAGGTFDPDSDFNYDGMMDACHRSGSAGSQQAYSQGVIAPGDTKPIAALAGDPGSGVQYHFVACSGDVTTGISETSLDAGKSRWGKVDQTSPTTNTPWWQAEPTLGYNEIPQADDGWLGPQTTLVTLTGGGNDARFTAVLSGCITVLPHCLDSDFHLNVNGTPDPEPLTTYEPEVIDALGAHLSQVYETIAQEAPHAEIVVVGYPRPFASQEQNPEGGCDIGAPVIVVGPEATWLNQMADLLDKVTGEQVASLRKQGVNIRFVNPDNPGDSTQGFTGHEVCDSTGRPNPAAWINGYVSKSTTGSGTTTPGAASFHPNAAGQSEFARLVNECLRGQDAC